MQIAGCELRSEEHTSELQSRENLVCRLLLPPPPSSTRLPYTTLFRSLYNLTHNPKTGAPGRIRTHDPLVRSQVLYPTELRALETIYCYQTVVTSREIIAD